MNITLYGDSILKGVLLEEGKYKMNRSWEQRLAAEHGAPLRHTPTLEPFPRRHGCLP